MNNNGISILKILFCNLLLLLNFNSTAQNKAEADTMKVHKVMLIPYDPRYYLSDADRDILEQSKIAPDKFRKSFRYSIDRSIQRAIGASYYCISLLNDTVASYEETMLKIFSKTGYVYEKAIPITPKAQDDDRIVIKSKTSDTRDHEDSKTASQYIPVKKDAKYMQAVVKNPNELFKELNEEYETDYFVFVTQFDIKTNYSSCLDIANKVYRREVMVHFTIYDKEGKIIAGSYATSYFPSNSNHPNKIIGDCFPELSRYVAGCLP
jgi:hypothetical protein